SASDCTDSFSALNKSGSLQAPCQNCFLRVEPVFGFIKYNGLRTVDNFVCYFLTAMRWKTMHKQSLRVCFGHQFGIDLIGHEYIMTACAIFLPHRNPCIGDDAINTACSLVGIGCGHNLSAFGPSPIDKTLVRLTAFRCCDVDIKFKTRCRLQQRMQHVIAIAHPSKGFPLNRTAMFLICK